MNTEFHYADTPMQVVALYGLAQKPNLETSIQLIGDLVTFLGEKPTHFLIGDKDGKTYRAPRYKDKDKLLAYSQYADYGHVGAVRYFEPNNIRDTILFVGARDTAGKLGFDTCFSKLEHPNVSPTYLLKLAKRFVMPCYGISYTLTLREGPIWFIGGRGSSGMSDQLARASGEFAETNLFTNKLTSGYFRDIFEWNYLTHQHFEKKVEGKFFRDWVNEPLDGKGWFKSKKTRGTLTEFEDGTAAWQVKPEELSEVRPKMMAAGLLMVKH